MAVVESFVRPSRLYRYRSLRQFDREIEALEGSYLHCASFTTLNDPMEGLFSSSRRLRKSEEYREIRKSIVENKSLIRMCSFSEVCNHELMWAHYADQFKGICIAYNFSRLLNKLADDVSFVRMFYNESEPIVFRNGADPSALARMVLSYKNYRWLYEREWRMFAEGDRAYYREAACVSSVYLGARISDYHRETIKARLKQIKIRTHEMAIRKYCIDFAIA